MKDFYQHPQAIVETEHIGKNSRIWAFAHILSGAKIGENANICDHSFIENDVIIGHNVTIKCGVFVWDGITLEDDVVVGPAAVFTNDRYPRSKNVDYKREKTLVKKGASIGANATILCGIVIGEYALIGAGAVVTKNVSPYTLVYGNPAQVKGHICSCGKKLHFINHKSSCVCGRHYVIHESKVKRNS